MRLSGGYRAAVVVAVAAEGMSIRVANPSWDAEEKQREKDAMRIGLQRLQMRWTARWRFDAKERRWMKARKWPSKKWPKRRRRPPQREKRASPWIAREGRKLK